MTALFLADLNGAGTPLLRRQFSRAGSGPSTSAGQTSTGGYNEQWLRDLLFRHPELLVTPGCGYDGVAPLCVELPIPRPGGAVYADIIGVTRSGKIAVIECKLWRNPQARREVIAQVLEYAALLRRWSFGDLTATIKNKLGTADTNPIYSLPRVRWPDLEEAGFVDAVTRSLSLGDFQLIVAGDGIRSDVQAIADHLNAQSSLARLTLLEMQLWQSASGGTVVLPFAPVRTEVLQQRVFVSGFDGAPLPLAPDVPGATEIEEVIESVVDPEAAGRRAANREFWQRFIDTVTFDHTDQPPPRHGGDNNVRLPLPEPAGWITAFRTSGSGAQVGLFLTFREKPGQRELFEDLTTDLATLRNDTGLDLISRVRSETPFWAEVIVTRPRSNFPDDDAQLDWLRNASNRFVSAIRPRLAILSEAAE